MRRVHFGRFAIGAAMFLALASGGLLLGGIGVGAGEQTAQLVRQDKIVPAGSALHVSMKGADGKVVEEYFLDPAHRVARVERLANGGIASVSIFDEVGHTTLNGITLEVYSAEAGYDSIVGASDPFAGVNARKTGTVEGAGRALGIWEASLPAPVGASPLTLRTVIDESIGLRVADELREGTTVVASTTREWVTLQSLGAELWSRASLSAKAVTMKEQYKAELANTSYPVFGLPEGYLGLRLLRIVPGDEWKNARLEYEADSAAPGAEVVVTTFDVSRIPDYPQTYLQPVEKAADNSDEVGEVLLFGKEGVGVKVQVVRDQMKADAREVAGALMAVN